jgi:hypothetical protein
MLLNRARPVTITQAQARRIWLRAQRLDCREPFGDGSEATRLAVEHLGYVQIDTIHVIERSHHHILHTRIPAYRRRDLQAALSAEKTVFEYWTHALSYVPSRDFRFFLKAMRDQRHRREAWFGEVTTRELQRVLRLLRENGPLTIRDIEDDVLVEKHHPWASRKPSKRALQLAFHMGLVTISARSGMLKTYDLLDRHFGWDKPPRAASERDINAYVLERAVRSQGLVSLDSACYLNAPRKPAIRALIETAMRRKALLPVEIEGAETVEHWAPPDMLEAVGPESELVHILSPFDPLVIQRKRLRLFFGYEHRFEAYVPKAKRVFGYFALPVLVGDEIVAALDLKTDRLNGALLVQGWSWVGRGSARLHKQRIEEQLDRFERFQLA